MRSFSSRFLFFFFNDTATTEIYTLSLHDALPISEPAPSLMFAVQMLVNTEKGDTFSFNEIKSWLEDAGLDRKSTRLNSSHSQISYAVFCLKKKKQNKQITTNNIDTSIT